MHQRNQSELGLQAQEHDVKRRWPLVDSGDFVVHLHPMERWTQFAVLARSFIPRRLANWTPFDNTQWPAYASVYGCAICRATSRRSSLSSARAEGPWEGERLAIKDAPICLQRDPFRRDMILDGSEDCLYLNVYTPERPRTNGSLPVMVWFHGGGWQCGSGISSFYGPDFLLDHDIVLVSANFRLGPLGFLSTETLDCPGNNGLKDQLEVLHWVRANIASFGGDPNSVTVFGESAGGASVTYHMLSEKSRGLLHRGIAQSGTYFNPWAQPAHKGVAAGRATKLAQIVGCGNAGEWPEKLECLRKKPAEDIVASCTTCS